MIESPLTCVIEQASIATLPRFSRLLQTVASDLEGKGQTLWTRESLEPKALARSYPAADMVLACQGNEAVGGLVIVEDDPNFWPAVAVGESLFVHKLAVLPSAQGTGVASQLLEFAQKEAKRRNKRYLRLDCAAERPGICRFYERRGFTRVGERTVGPFFAALYERSFA